MSFSYNIALPLLRGPDPLRTDGYREWVVMEKGKAKSQQKRLSCDVIRSALLQITEHILQTSLCQSSLLRTLDYNIYLKKECLQHTNSIKARGVAYTLLQLSDAHKRNGVIAISTGNFAHTLCYYGQKFKIPVTIVMPTSLPNEVIKKCRRLADPTTTIIVEGNNIVEAHEIALTMAQAKKLFYLDGNDNPNMIIGQATLGLEIIEQLETFDAVMILTLIDSCGLTLGIAVLINSLYPNIKVIEVQTTVPHNLIPSIRSRTTLPNELIIPMTEYTMYSNDHGVLQNSIKHFSLVNEESIVVAASYLLEEENIEDPYTTICLAAFVTGELIDLRGKR